MIVSQPVTSWRELKEDTKIVLDVDFEKLYANMLEQSTVAV